MAVYFVYRVFGLGPTEKYLKRFNDESVCDWFRTRWTRLASDDMEVADARLSEELGCDGWRLSSLFHEAGESRISPPESIEQLVVLLQRHFEDDQVRSDSPHVLQILTEEDGEGGAIYFFDDHFLNQSGPLATFLLHEDWRLPSAHGSRFAFKPTEETQQLQPAGVWQGTTYVAMLTKESKYPMDDLMGGYRLDGIRLPKLSHHLIRSSPVSREWPRQLRHLPPLLMVGLGSDHRIERVFLQSLLADPQGEVHWGAWSDWREDHGLEPLGVALLRGAFERISHFPGRLIDQLPTRTTDLNTDVQDLLSFEEKHRDELLTASRSFIHVEDHLAQIALHTAYTDAPFYDQWIIFDDLWAGEHPDFANTILRFARRWDVLSTN